MARKDALLRFHERLVDKRDSLRRKLAEDYDLAVPAGFSGGRDVGDTAADGETSEINSQIAALESRELNQVEQAILRIRQGRYGRCDGCNGAIPVARLRALPYTTLCVECQRQAEESGFDAEDLDGDWESVFEHEGRMSEREFSLRDIHVDD